jgi:YegS/Rv2252/BmrU family lipid kinase
MSNNKWSVIVNPNAGSRQTEIDLPQIELLLQNAGISYTLHFTEKKSHATELASKIITEGSTQLICVGGDGTLNEIVNGIFSQDKVAPSGITLAIIPVGIGNDWCRTHDISLDYEKAIELIRLQNSMLHDIGKVSFGSGDETGNRYFINVAGMGFDAEVAYSVNRMKLNNPAVGKWLYLRQLFMCLMRARSKYITVNLDSESISAEIFSMCAGICRYNGGGMQQLPYAISDDGWIDMTIIRKVGKIKVLMNVHKLFNGKLETIREVTMHKAKQIRVACDEELMLECDGENIGRQPYSFEIIPQAVRVITGILKKD